MLSEAEARERTGYTITACWNGHEKVEHAETFERMLARRTYLVVQGYTVKVWDNDLGAPAEFYG